MAAGVREITIRRGYDPREFPMVVAGGAGPNHACAIATELELPLFLVPRESSIFCAAGMLMTDLKHDVVKSRIARLSDLPREHARVRGGGRLPSAVARSCGRKTFPKIASRSSVQAEMRYVRQYHEVSLALFPLEDLEQRFHAEHNRLYGYSLADEETPLELINLRARAIGVTDKPETRAVEHDGPDPEHARKGERRVWIPEDSDFRPIPVFDGHCLRYGNRFRGPAVVEQRNTTLFVSAAFNVVVDSMDSFVVFRRDRIDALPREFACRGGSVMIDPILASVFARAFKSVTDEMSISLQRTTRSPILCEAKDFVTGLYDADGKDARADRESPDPLFLAGSLSASTSASTSATTCTKGT